MNVLEIDNNAVEHPACRSSGPQLSSARDYARLVKRVVVQSRFFLVS